MTHSKIVATITRLYFSFIPAWHLRLRQYYPDQEVINEQSDPNLAETPHYKEKQTILPNPIHLDGGSGSSDHKKHHTPIKRTHDGKPKKPAAEKKDINSVPTVVSTITADPKTSAIATVGDSETHDDISTITVPVEPKPPTETVKVVEIVSVPPPPQPPPLPVPEKKIEIEAKIDMRKLIIDHKHHKTSSSHKHHSSSSSSGSHRTNKDKHHRSGDHRSTPSGTKSASSSSSSKHRDENRKSSSGHSTSVSSSRAKSSTGTATPVKPINSIEKPQPASTTNSMPTVNIEQSPSKCFTATHKSPPSMTITNSAAAVATAETIIVVPATADVHNINEPHMPPIEPLLSTKPPPPPPPPSAVPSTEAISSVVSLQSSTLSSHSKHSTQNSPQQPQIPKIKKPTLATGQKTPTASASGTASKSTSDLLSSIMASMDTTPSRNPSTSSF